MNSGPHSIVSWDHLIIVMTLESWQLENAWKKSWQTSKAMTNLIPKCAEATITLESLYSHLYFSMARRRRSFWFTQPLADAWRIFDQTCQLKKKSWQKSHDRILKSPKSHDVMTFKSWQGNYAPHLSKEDQPSIGSKFWFYDMWFKNRRFFRAVETRKSTETLLI